MTQPLEAYQKQSLFGGWTRIELLLSIYDRAIDATEKSKQAHQQGDDSSFAIHYLDCQKAILAIHAGLKPDEHDVAFNVARLLHFVLVSLENRKFDDALNVLRELRNGFNAIEKDAIELEKSGQIPALVENEEYAANA